MKTQQRFWIGLSLPFLLTSTCEAQEDVSVLLKRVPDWANAVTIVRLEKGLQSPRGVRQGWAAKYELDYLGGAVAIPSSVKTMVMATRFQSSEAEPTTIAVAVSNKKRRLSLEDAASREGGEIQTVANHRVIITSRNSYVVELEPGLMAVMHPANRQELARWLRFADRNQEPVLSAYLRNAVSTGRGAPIQMAIDLEDIVDPKALHHWLPHSKVVSAKKESHEALEELLKGLKGVRFTARVDDKATGEVRLDFAESVASHSDTIKGLFLESLDELGAALDDFHKCQVRMEAQGKTVVLKTELSDDNLRRIMSLIQIPSIDNESEGRSPGAGSAAEKADPTATKRYFTAVQRMLDDLKKKAKKADDYPKTTVWHETYARRITQLPREGVDKEMLEYGGNVSIKLSALASSLRGDPLKVDLLQGQKYSYSGWSVYRGRRSPSVPTYTDTNIPEMTKKQREAIAQGQTDREKIWKALDEDEYRIRRGMAEKYRTTFELSK